MDDPRIRLLNRLYARKRKELKERERLKVITSLFLQSCNLTTITFKFVHHCIEMFSFDKLLESGIQYVILETETVALMCSLECWDRR